MTMKKRSDFEPPDDDDGIESLLEGPWRSADTIDLGNLFTKELTASGSFDIRSGIWATTLGKVLQALPIPALLVDESYDVVVANQACARISQDYERMQGTSFVGLFPDSAATETARSLLAKIFSTRRPHVAEALMQIDNQQIWGRVTFRSIRIMDQRFILVLIEDLTRQKKQLLLSRKQEEQLRLCRDGLEKRVEKRTATLKAVNEELQLEIQARRQVEDALRTLIRGIESNIKEHNDRTFGNLRLVIKPLVDQLKTEKLPERARHLLQSIEGHLADALSSFEYNVSGLSPELTPQELRVCELIRSGLSTKQIAEVLETASGTVFFHRTSIRKKLGLVGRDEDLAAYLRKKL
jgi:DNA-binding CsgD family transcriptional regulator